MSVGRHIPAHVGDPDENAAIAHADRLVQADVWVVGNIDVRNFTVLIQPIERFLVKFPYLIEWSVALSAGHDVAKKFQ